MTAVAPCEMQWQVDGLQLAGLAWGDAHSPPILALHGWLDNAASFAMLAPLLAERFYVVAPDLSGHGQSSWRSADATYQVYDDVPQLIGLVEQLGWQRFALMGHSRGAIISSLLAASFPEYVHHLVLLDGIAPPPLDDDCFVEQMRSFILDRKRLARRQYKVYASEAELIAVREDQGLTHTAAKLIVHRNLRTSGDGYTWSMDPRLRGASAVKLTQRQVDAVLNSLSMPTLLLMAEEGLAVNRSEEFVELAKRIPGALHETTSGGHHFHMEEGVVTLAQRIQHFLLDHG